ncbi:MAG: hypothetical protein M1834_006907 [Cirrosporium novae-zelandiae]|nr:MAG: hypothetical protein M1834_006907 [Cirrosporium novae-zelandiae]
MFSRLPLNKAFLGTAKSYDHYCHTRGVLSSIPLSVQVSQKEKDSGSLTWQNLELATRAIHRDGLVVLENVLENQDLDFLNEKMVQDARTLQALGDSGPFNYNKGNIQQDPPMTPTYFNSSIFLNPIATQVTTSVLGPKPRLSFVSGNSALPPAANSPPQSQPVHSDADIDHPSCPFALVINIPLIDMNIENGSTEVWLGTHTGSGINCQEGAHGERASGRIKEELLRNRREERAPSQPVVKKGSIVVRDLRLWHAGKPNYSEAVRVMLAMIHFAPWYRNEMKVQFAQELKAELEEKGSDLQIQADFIPAKSVEEGYLNKPFGNAYDFDQKDPLVGIF